MYRALYIPNDVNPVILRSKSMEKKHRILYFQAAHLHMFIDNPKSYIVIKWQTLWGKPRICLVYLSWKPMEFHEFRALLRHNIHQ